MVMVCHCLAADFGDVEGGICNSWLHRRGQPGGGRPDNGSPVPSSRGFQRDDLVITAPRWGAFAIAFANWPSTDDGVAGWTVISRKPEQRPK